VLINFGKKTCTRMVIPFLGPPLQRLTPTARVAVVAVEWVFS
jgi:hypothetical protein